MKQYGNAVLALLLAGSVVFCGGWSRGRVKEGAVVGGVEVGGMTYAEAERAVRAKIAADTPPFTVRTPAGVFSFPLSFTDDVPSLVRSAKKGQTLPVFVERTWADAEEDLLTVCRANAREPADAEVGFSAGGFHYTPEREGSCCNYPKLLAAALGALREGKTELCFVPAAYAPAITEETLRLRTQKIAAFSTHYDAKNLPRSHNIELAAARISGSVLEPGGEFSFNKVVGKRTEANGFSEANVILDGEFVPGVGGGVCQTSTTLFNAALRAGMEITESRPHSLAVSYVPPSLDAMVSNYSDLKFVNRHAFPVYILAEAGSGSVKFTFFGAPDGRRYVTESRVLSHIEPPPEEIVEGEEDRVLRAERVGVASESYLSIYEGQTLVSRTRLRRDTYACVRGRRQIKREEGGGAEENAPEGQNFP